MREKGKGLSEMYQEAHQEPSLREWTEQRAARLSTGMGRLPASFYGWSDPDTDEEIAAQEEQLEERGLADL
mgnify:CR=1 FL=1